MKKLILLIFAFLAIANIKAEQRYSRAKIWFDGKPASQLAGLGIDLSEGTFKKNTWFMSDFSEDEIARINHAGFRTEIIIDDVVTFYQSRSNNDRTAQAPSLYCGATQPEYAVPSHFHLGDMGGFFTYNQMIDILDSMHLLYPNLISLKQSIDTINSIEGRPIFYLKISDNPDLDENEPEVLYDAVHHAREPESMSQLIYYMWYLLENYSSDTAVKALVDNTEMYFIPCVNPDGYIYNEATNPNGGGMWRKNMRDNLDGTFGVDINRNYGFEWGYDTLGSSINTNSATYRGTAPFSEPETQAIRNFINSRQFVLAINYHSYGEHHILPWGFIPDTLTPDSTLLQLYGERITRYNNHHVGTTNQTLNYLVNGETDDWMYGEQSSKQKIFAMTPEIGQDYDGFWPAPGRIIPLCQQNMYSNITLARLAGKYGIVNHNESRYVSQLSNYFPFSFQQMGLDTTGTFTISITPISSNITSVGNPVIVSGLSVLQSKDDSISFMLSSGISPTDEIEYIVTVNNGLYSESDTISQLYGSPLAVFVDNPLSIQNWYYPSTTWELTDEDSHSPPFSITDSRYSDYVFNADEKTDLLSAVSLSGAIDARLSFYAKWNIEKDFDYVQVLASPDHGQHWFPLCGKYTVTGSTSQVIGEPVYDGNHFNWVAEEMSLNNFLGQDILIRFEIVTDQALEYDGFYFDDLKIQIIQPGNSNSNDLSQVSLSNVYPNPASDISTISYSNIEAGSKLNIYNTLGEIIWFTSLTNTSGRIEIPAYKFSSGIYSFSIQQPDGKRTEAKKWIIGER